MSSKERTIPIDHAWIVAHIPHQGSMCLLDRVESWNETTILCRAHNHLDTNNPLRAAGSLGIVNGIEYAAQAMAVHGALLANDDQTASAGFLTSVRNVRWHRQRLDDVDAELLVRAERLSGNELNILYEFSLYCAETLLLSGRVSVMLNVNGRNTSYTNLDNPS